MLSPFDYLILTVDDAKALLEFIEKVTSTPKLDRNYDKMEKMGIREIYSKMRTSVEKIQDCEDKLRSIYG